MSEPQEFLKRWSRRKLAAQEGAEAAKPAEHDAPADADAAPVAQDLSPQSPPAANPAEPEFDVSSLPPIESIGADTDIRAFLRPGVPESLRHAALRRVWAADPAIRDFRGLAENDWDFNDPNAAFGFGRLGPDVDLRKLVTQVFEDPEPVQSEESVPSLPNQQASRPTTDTDAAGPDAPVDNTASTNPDSNLSQREESIASQQETPAAEKKRRHGGALPQ